MSRIIPAALLAACTTYAATVAPSPVPEAKIRDSATRSVALLEKIGDNWKIPCFSCHHQGLTFMMYGSARKHGLPLSEEAVLKHASKTMAMFSSPAGVLTVGVDPLAFGYAINALDVEHVAPNFVTSVATKRMAGVQMPDGHWPASDRRPPSSYSEFASTSLAIRAISLYLPPQYSTERDGRFARARAWLLSHPAESTEDRTFRLFGLTWAGGTLDERKQAASSLLESQRSDGGWAQVDEMKSDAYSTGEALVALRQSGVVTRDDAAYQRGVRFLLDTQYPDGSWLVETRLHSPAPISPPFMDSGFPHGKNQFISAAATNWAAMALMEALPEVRNPAQPLPVDAPVPKRVEKWMEIAALGTVEELKALLDAGLDPNTTKDDISLLMAATPELDKMRLLLARGAKVSTTSEPALNVALICRDSAAAVRLLIEHGAPAVPKDVRAESTPLFTASQGGDLEAIKVLFDHGADVTHNGGMYGEYHQTPLMNAIMVGSTEVVRYLLAKGSDPNQRDEFQMTPLMWASIMHRAEIVKVLLDAGADPALVDKFKMNALQHAADIAYFDSQTAAVLSSPTARQKANSGE